MGFGSYDESERDDRSIDTDLDEESVDARETDHEGRIEFENGASNEQLIDRLKEIKDED